MQDPVPYIVDRPRLPAIALMQCPLAGFQFYAAEKYWGQLRIHDPLSLVREPGNHHDPRAVRVEWNGLVLGYLPREANYAISQMLDRGHPVSARIAVKQECDDPWKRIMLEVDWKVNDLDPAPSPEGEPAIAYVNLGAFVVGPPPSKIELVRGAHGLTENAQRIGALALARSSADIIARLAMPVTGQVGPTSRSVRLWNLVEITITSDGRTLSARPLDEGSKGAGLSADLSMPLSKGAWTRSFAAILDRAMQRHDMEPSVLAGAPASWLERSLRRTFDGFVDFAAMGRAVLDFLAPDLLTRSLANRIFDNAPTAEQFNWCGRHRAALCLAAIEHAPLLPFLRFVELDGKLCQLDPMTSLPTLLARIGMEPGAIKRLERWGYEPFSDLGQELVAGASLRVLSGFANLLWRLYVVERPPWFFSRCAGAAANWFDCDGDDPIFGTLVPDWFTSAILREVARLGIDDLEAELGEQVLQAMPWIASMPPEPDANQRKAGWPWIMQRARLFEIQLEKGEWPVPLDELEIDGYRVVPIRTVAQLKTEALEMKNCLESYAEKCRLGVWAVFSIRTLAFGGGKRLANVAVVKTMTNGRVSWRLQQVAGKMNAKVSGAIIAVAEAVVVALNSVT